MGRMISNQDEIINSLDINDRFDELQGEFDARLDALNDFVKGSADWLLAKEDYDSWKEENIEEFESLQELIEDCKDFPDWDFGIVLIREDHFVDYCKEMIEDCGDLPKDLPDYIKDNIDWDGVADSLRIDYSEVDFDDATYLIRS
jgi:hypothetical protein